MDTSKTQVICPHFHLVGGREGDSALPTDILANHPMRLPFFLPHQMHPRLLMVGDDQIYF